MLMDTFFTKRRVRIILILKIFGDYSPFLGVVLPELLGNYEAQTKEGRKGNKIPAKSASAVLKWKSWYWNKGDKS